MYHWLFGYFSSAAVANRLIDAESLLPKMFMSACIYCSKEIIGTILWDRNCVVDGRYPTGVEFHFLGMHISVIFPFLERSLCLI